MSITIDNITLTDEQVQSVIEQSKKKKGFFKPEPGEKFYYVHRDYNRYEIGYGFWGGDKFDYFFLSEGNCFKTRQEAEQHKTYLEALQRVRLYIMENHYFEPDWSNEEQEKWNIEYDHKDKEFFDDCEWKFEKASLLPYLASIEAYNDVIKNCEDDLKIIFNV